MDVSVMGISVAAKSLPVNTRIGLVLILLLNAYPVFAVEYLGWSTTDLLLAYWVEGLIIGFYGIMKMFYVSLSGAVEWNWVGRSFIGFFAFYYLLSLYSYLLVLYAFNLLPESPVAWAGDAVVLEPAKFIPPLFLDFRFVIFFALALLVHGASFFLNYVGSREYLSAKPNNSLFSPVFRVVYPLLAVLVAGVAQVPALVIIGLKVPFDVVAHLRERERFSDKPPDYLRYGV